MAISNPPQTDDPNVNFILLEIIKELNLRPDEQLKLFADIRAASDLADLKERIDRK